MTNSKWTRNTPASGTKGFVNVTRGILVPSVIIRANSESYSAILLDSIPDSTYEKGDPITVRPWDWIPREPGEPLELSDLYKRLHQFKT